MSVLSELERLEKVFVSAIGEYYLAVTRRAPEDSHLPSPSPALVSLLSTARTSLEMNAVGVQVAQDTVATASAVHTTTEPVPTTNVEQVEQVEQVEEVTNPTVVLSANAAAPAPLVTAPAEVTSSAPAPELNP